MPAHLRASYQRQDDEARGRHLVATRRIQENELIFCERPLCSLQSVGNCHRGALVCRSCRAFCGGPELSLKLASGSMSRQDVFSEEAGPTSGLVPCRQKCGEVYCSADCEQDFWPSHSFLCTGPIEDEEHPLLEWKRHAIVNNEIFLLVGDVLSIILAHPELKEQFTDFTLVPWWTVATMPLINQPMGFTEATSLDQSCRELCAKSSALLNAALKLQGVDTKGLITPLFIAQIIGSFEQNSMGIRSRHPLCRDVFDNDELRDRNLGDVILCLERAGFIGDGDCEDEDCEDEECDVPEGEEGEKTNDVSDTEAGEMNASTNEEDQQFEVDDGDEPWVYSADEIAHFLAGLDIDEREADDDMEAIFTPLDGTAMYSTTCKMNHSCNPNVVVLYHGRKWNDPLVARCVAKRDIEEGEELCISYVDVNQAYEARQAELANYGFKCSCVKCQLDGHGHSTKAEQEAEVIDEDALFGDDDDESEQEDADGEREEGKANENGGLEALHQKLEEIKTNGDESPFGAMAIQVFAEAQSFVVQYGTAALQSLDQSSSLASELTDCLAATKLRHFNTCAECGARLENRLYAELQENGSWPAVTYREVYWIGSIVASIGLAQDGSFMQAQRLLDKAIVLGLERVLIRNFFLHVEQHANEMHMGALVGRSIAFDALDLASEPSLKHRGLSKAIAFAIPEIEVGMGARTFEQEYVSKVKTVVVRGLAREWDAISKWRNMSWFAREHGHRMVPIEIGSILSKGGMVEKMMNVRSFVSDYLAPSSIHPIWALEDTLSLPTAYLAQHALLDQIPDLLQDVEAAPSLCGSQGPTRINVWMGTGGTRTPLHYDSYDNLLVQIVGAKYVRIYGKEETPKLYVMKEGVYALQGNMSAVDCEREDFDLHPLATDAVYQEVLLMPGDCLFIPSRVWHYVRSLSTSVSVNYWW